MTRAMFACGHSAHQASISGTVWRVRLVRLPRGEHRDLPDVLGRMGMPRRSTGAVAGRPADGNHGPARGLIPPRGAVHVRVGGHSPSSWNPHRPHRGVGEDVRTVTRQRGQVHGHAAHPRPGHSAHTRAPTRCFSIQRRIFQPPEFPIFSEFERRNLPGMGQGVALGERQPGLSPRSLSCPRADRPLRSSTSTNFLAIAPLLWANKNPAKTLNIVMFSVSVGSVLLSSRSVVTIYMP